MNTEVASLSPRDQKYYERGWMDEIGSVLFNTLHEDQVRACEIFAENQCLGTYSEETKKFEYITYAELGQLVDRTRDALKHLGVGEFDKIGLISNNRWEWVAVTCAAHSLSASIVPMYEAQLPSDWSYITNDSGIKVLCCATQDIYDRVQEEVVPGAPALQSTLCFDAPEGEPHAFATLLAQAAEDSEKALVIAPTEDDLASLIYTSGTTGKPKGVELTHLNICSNVKSAARTMVANPRDFVKETDRSLAFLPWAHSYGQTCELWVGITHGCSTGICRGVPKILDDLQLVKPTVLYGVPTLYKKVYDGVSNLVENSSPLRKRLMTKAFELGAKKYHEREDGGEQLGFLENFQYNILDRVVLSKIRDRFGGNLRFAFVAGAACPLEVIRFMDACGIKVLEGYGLTETSPIITINSIEQRSVGSVGRAVGGVEVFIMGEDGKPVADGEEGEICCTGPNVMRGYYNKPEETEKVISVAPDGKTRMFHTGDLGRKCEDGWLRVTGRIKEQYKLENGKYVAPGPIEEAISLSRFVAQAVLVGANRPYNVVLLVPEWTAIRTEFKISDKVTDAELAEDQRVKDLIDAQLEMSCYNFKKFEIPTKWAFVEPFTAANEMLTPKMSIRKHKVVQAYKHVLDELYEGGLTSEASDGAEKKEEAA